jgi:hypothetical protein
MLPIGNDAGRQRAAIEEPQMHIVVRIFPVPVPKRRRLIQVCAGALWLLGAATCAAAMAADARTPPDIAARYQRERAACESGKSTEDRASCLREAAAARDAAAHGDLEEPADYKKNALARCDAVPASDRDACRHRALGEGEMSGSVSGGGIIRKYREIILPPAAGDKAQGPSAAQQQDREQGR